MGKKQSHSSSKPPFSLDRWKELEQKVSLWQKEYHQEDSPSVSDAEYDRLFAEFKSLSQKLKKASPILDRVGAKPLESFEKVDHRRPMLSLQNSYNETEIKDFDQRTRKFLKSDKNIEYFCEPKLDGLAIEVIYEDGMLTQAITRGDGQTGEDVTQNIKTIKSLPHKLEVRNPPTLLEVRGEVIISKKSFETLNKKQIKNGEASFANPRNAAAGSIRNLDPAVAKSRPLDIFIYGTGVVEGYKFKSQKECMEYATKVGLPTLEKVPLMKTYMKFSKSVDEICKIYAGIQEKKEKLPYEVDGLVIKVNDFGLQEELGYTARSPRWASAAKLSSDQAETVISDIIVQVGRTGALTPVAIMEPVLVGGVVVTHATLHNQDEIHRKNVNIGDRVLIQRAGDVIPEVLKVVKAKGRDKKPFKIPNKCPECKEKAVHLKLNEKDTEAALRCINTDCPAILKEKLKHFVSRRAMNIDKIGNQIVEQLYNAGLVLNFSDFYKLKKDDLMNLERQGEKSAQNILDSIENSKNIELYRLIFSLGVRFIGEQTAKRIANEFKTIEELFTASQENLENIEDVGEIGAESFISAFKDPKTIKEVKKLDKALNIKKPIKTRSQKFSGKIFVITGTHSVKRQEVQTYIESKGGKCSSSVSKNTSYLVAGEAAGSKLEKALSLKIPVVNWKELQSL